MEGIESFRTSTRGRSADLNMSLGLPAKKKEEKYVPEASVVITDCGVYQFEKTAKQRRTETGAGQVDFNPDDFLRNRKSK